MRDLENYLSGDPIAARPASFRYRVIKKAKRHRAIFATVLLAIFLLEIINSICRISRSLEIMYNNKCVVSLPKSANKLFKTD